MSDKLKIYLDGIFSPYEDIKAIKEIKQELSHDLQEKMEDLKREGFSEETAYHKTIDSIGDISEIVEAINEKTIELQKSVGMDLSKSNMENSDFTSVKVHDGKFNYSNLQGSNFSDADLSNSSFKCSNLDKAKFDRANLRGAKINKSNLGGASFKEAILDGTDFSYSNLSGICFDNQTFKGTIFNNAGLKGTSFKNAVFHNVSFKTNVKKAEFDGATMDKLTYAILKGYKAKLDNVTVV
ncbi:pentapeptide repeat-containing protein [Neobacillus notoginsengisoli]|uniref:Pentapeptide repeat-containing protein n=1 Tax=Neobacillus notoginsengisoli TaxID=1578198 RepID=A0A417Z063_9BACI|nr:pentapeptide repeat-containing protein [Neobacillus notoginsengisoli]RHW43533.1 pentapeptide repeat-containing protein [Neobacillus notoginsengisoli]